MATTPPEQPAGSRPPMGIPNLPAGARLPIPGNAEFAFFVAIEIFLAILLFDDAWNVNDWAKWSAILGGAYLISRGIAKASRVLEQ
jgi:hypothetical protein